MAFKYINRHEIAGFCTVDVEVRDLKNGDSVAEVAVATNHSYKIQDKWHEETEYHNCIFYRKLAESAAETLKKGAAVFVVGRSYTRKWTGKDGKERTRREVIVDHFHPIVHVKKEKDAAAGQDAHDEAPPMDDSTAGFGQ